MNFIKTSAGRELTASYLSWFAKDLRNNISFMIYDPLQPVILHLNKRYFIGLKIIYGGAHEELFITAYIPPSL